MAGMSCVIKPADSTAFKFELEVTKAEQKLYQPYLSKLPESKQELVKPTIDGVDRRTMTHGHSLRRHSVNYTDVQHSNAYYNASIEKIRQEEMHSIVPAHGQFPITEESLEFHNGTVESYKDGKHARVRSVSPPLHRPYDLYTPTRKRIESVPTYNSLATSDLTSRLEQRSHYPMKCPDGCPCSTNPRQLTRDSKSRSHAKPRFKFTPLRDDIPYKEAGGYNFYEHLYKKSLQESRGNLPKPPHQREDRSPDCRWSYCASQQKYDEKHPYYRPRDCHSTKSTLETEIRYGYDLSKYGEEYNSHRRLLKTSESRSSAFSVIRPSAVHRVYSSESGYSSDPSNVSAIRHSNENSNVEFKHRYYSMSENVSPNHSNQTFSEQSRHNSGQHDRYVNGHRLHVYDEASKAALQAFDAHVEKMMAEKREKQTRDLHAANDIEHNRKKYETLEKVKDELNDQDQMKREHRFTSSSSLPSLVQVSTVDSTQSTDTKSGLSGLLGLTMVANEHLGQAIAKEKKRTKNNNCLHLWQFLRSMLDQEKNKPNKCIEWTNRDRGEFRLIKTAVIADLWGQSKNRTCMTYEKMARAMRYYYKMKILEKVPHKRLHFRFGEKMLARVLDSSTIKPLRHTSSAIMQSAPNAEFNPYKVTNEDPNLHRKNIIVQRPSSEGSIHTLNLMSYPMNEGATVPGSPFLTEHRRSVSDVVSHLTPVICKNTTNMFFPQDFRLETSNSSVIRSNHSPRKNDFDVTPPLLRCSDSDNGMGYSGEETPVSSPMSDNDDDDDGELVVDLE